MPDWQERINRETRPAIRAEHELRYAAAAPIVHASDAWLDLGCGIGLAAGAGIGATYEGLALLVDVDEGALEIAGRSIVAREVVTLAADLTAAAALEQVRERLLAAAGDGPACITCFETIEHLATFAPLVELLVELASRHRCTVVLSVPNDAFWAVENPHHATMWGEGAVEELRLLLPGDHVLVQQVALHGSALARSDDDTQEVAMVSATAEVPTHLVLAFGERAGELAMTSRVVQTDLDEQRRWERQRESDLRYYAAQADAAQERLTALQARVGELEDELERASAGAGGAPPSPAGSDA